MKLRYICTICHKDAGRRRVVTLDDGRHYGPVCESAECQAALIEREQGTRLSA